MKKSLLTISAVAFATLGVIRFGYADIQDSYNKMMEARAESAVETYYHNVNASDDSTLFNNLRSTISSGYKSIGYDGLYGAYASTDVRSDGYIRDLYSNMTNYPTNSKQCGNYSSIGDCYNREHTIPQSWWGKGTSNQGCDIFIVYPSDGKINNMRSSYPFGETTSGKRWALDGDPDGNRVGTSTSTQYVSGTVFEPFDDRKGDMARTYFYAVTRWSTSSSWTKGDGSKVFGKGSETKFNLVSKYLDMLIKWHHDDPVDQFEIKRNQAASAIQMNRNPYIDHPSYVDLIWGGEYPSDGLNYEYTADGTATVVNGHIVAGDPVDPEGININQTSIIIKEEGSYTLTASVTPSNSSYKTLEWSSSDTSVASVTQGGVVTGIQPGTAIITVKVAGYTPEIKKTCSVTVLEKEDPTPPTPDPDPDPPAPDPDPPEPTPPTPTPSGGGNNGCGGNIITASIILSALSLTGIIILLLRRRKRVQ